MFGVASGGAVMRTGERQETHKQKRTMMRFFVRVACLEFYGLTLTGHSSQSRSRFSIVRAL